MLFSLVPRFPSLEREYVYAGRSLAWYLFSHEHDVLKKGPELLEQKDVLHVVQPTMRSTLGMHDIHPPIAYIDTCSKLPATFALFSVLSLPVRPRTIKVFLPPFYPQQCSREKKYQALITCTTSMFAFQSGGAWERGYKNVTISPHTYIMCPAKHFNEGRSSLKGTTPELYPHSHHHCRTGKEV